jgi:hypothetical protein
MKKVGYFILHAVGLVLLIALATGFQTSFWAQLFGTLPGPLIWLLFFLYLALYRKPMEAIGLSYLCAAQVYFFGWIPFGLLLFNVIILYGIVYLVKERIFWPGPRYFMIASFLAVLIYQIIYIVNSWLFELLPIRDIMFFERIFQTIVTPIFASPVYYILKFWERLTDQTPLIESGEIEI